jgi:hypothetical protein
VSLSPGKGLITAIRTNDLSFILAEKFVFIDASSAEATLASITLYGLLKDVQANSTVQVVFDFLVHFLSNLVLKDGVSALYGLQRFVFALNRRIFGNYKLHFVLFSTFCDRLHDLIVLILFPRTVRAHR